MSRGYIVIAQNTPSVDYLQQAYALALNLKLTQKEVSNLTVCVDDTTEKFITDQHQKVFDRIVKIPWNDDAEEDRWKVKNKWKYYYMTPYDETVILDTDMIFPTDVSFWWDRLSTRDFWACTNVKTFRNENVTSDYYRKVFTGNNLPNVYTAFCYFKKCNLSAELFSLIEIIFQHWQRFYYKYLPNNKPEHVSGDVVYALAMRMLGIEHECTNPLLNSLPTFVHMKSHVQNIPHLDQDWCESIPTYYRSYNDFKIGNFQQSLPFHYVNKEWMTKEKIEQMEIDYAIR